MESADSKKVYSKVKNSTFTGTEARKKNVFFLSLH